MLLKLVTMPTLCHMQFVGFRLVCMAVSKLPMSQAAFLEYTEPHGIWSKEAGLDFWKSIDPDFPVNFFPDMNDVLLTAEPPTNHINTQESIAQATEHQMSFCLHGGIGNLPANRLAKSPSPSPASTSNAPLGDYTQPEQHVQPRNKYSRKLGVDLYHSPQTDITPHISFLAVDQHQPLSSTREIYEAADPLYLNSLTGLPHRTSDLLPTASSRKSSKFTNPLHVSTNPILERYLQSSPAYALCGENPIAVESHAGGLQELQSNARDCSVRLRQAQLRSSPNSSQDDRRSSSAQKRSKNQSFPRVSDIPLERDQEHFPNFMQEFKRLKSSHHTISQKNGKRNRINSGLVQSDIRVGMDSDQQSGNSDALSSSEALEPKIANIAGRLLDPVAHGYVQSLKSFIGILKSDTINFTLESGFQVEESDAKQFMLHWDQARIPYTPPFDSTTLRRKHIKSCFEIIISKEYSNPEITKEVTDVAKSMCKKINQNSSFHGGIPYHDRLILKTFKTSFIEKIQFASKAALFLVRAINSMFSDGENLLNKEQDNLDTWVFLRKFLEDFSFFQPNFEQKYSWLIFSKPDSVEIVKILESMKSKIERSIVKNDYISFPWVLTQVWLIERRPRLWDNIKAPGGRLDQRLQTIFYKYFTYLSKPIDLNSYT